MSQKALAMCRKTFRLYTKVYEKITAHTILRDGYFLLSFLLQISVYENELLQKNTRKMTSARYTMTVLLFL